MFKMFGDLWIKDYFAGGVSGNHYTLQNHAQH